MVHLNVSGSLDGVALDSLLSRALLKTPPSGTLQEVTGYLHITGAVHFAHSLTVHSVNSKHFSSHLKNVSVGVMEGSIVGLSLFID